MRKSVHVALRYGRENAIPAQTLARILGYRSVRDLQKAVEAERASGAVILSDHAGGGYYLSNDPVELRRFTRTLYARARNTMKAAESAQRLLDTVTAQQMEGWFGAEDSRDKEKAAPGAGTSESGSDTNDTDKSINDSGIVPQKVRSCNDGNQN